MSRIELDDGSVELRIVLSRDAVASIDAIIQLTGGSEEHVVEQLIIDGSDIRMYVENHSDRREIYRIELPEIVPEPGPNVVQFRQPRKASPNNSD